MGNMRYYTRRTNKGGVFSCVQESGTNVISGVLLELICHRSSGLPPCSFLY